jgi:UPF0755 protein
MLPRKDRRIVLAALVLFLAGQPLIFANIPLDTATGTTPVVVKKGMHLIEVARLLKEDEFVRSSALFMAYALVVHQGKVIAGEYELSKTLSIADIASRMASGQRKVYTLRIVEGYNLQAVGDALEKAGIMESAAFFRLAKDEKFLQRVGIPAHTLEGYLAPETYYFSKETDVDVLLEKIVRRTMSFFDKEEVKARMTQLGMSPHEALTLASMIEKEAKMEEEKGLISAVFRNRLQDGMSLDCDPTVMYGVGMASRPLTRADLAAPTAYNTYRLKGLPKGPICSPSRSSLMAALYPAPSDVLYFVSRNDGSHVFSRRIEEHNHFVTMYQKKTKKP